VTSAGDDDIDRSALAALATGAVPPTGFVPAEPTPASSAAAVATPEPTPVGGVPILAGPHGRRRWLRIAVKTVVVVLVVAVGYYAVTLFQVWSVGRSDQARPVDAIVVMGAAQYDGRPSPELQARLDQVVLLWQRGLAPLVVTTGGKLPGDRFTEAEAGTEYLVAHGVPRAAILRENVAHTSYDSLVGVRDLLVARNLRSVLLVSDPFHSLRIRLVAEELGLTAYVSPTRTSPVRGRTELLREVKEAAGIALGRIIGFRRLLAITG
jgi:uncharacterized SAM-binding protein YcdF (DUF218 family)